MLDSIGWVLSVYKDDAEVECELQNFGLPGGSALIHAPCWASGWTSSMRSLALRRIVPLMHTGMRYDQAVASIAEYGHHSQRFVVGAGQHTYLPSFYEPERKYAHKSDRVGSRCSAMAGLATQPRGAALEPPAKWSTPSFGEYGPPTAVHIEMARDLSRPKDERDKVKALRGVPRPATNKPASSSPPPLATAPKPPSWKSGCCTGSNKANVPTRLKHSTWPV